MAKLSDVARITLDGLDSTVDHTSSLAEQATLVYEAARRFAQTQRFQKIVYLNQYPGYEGPLVMKRLVEDLFPLAPRDKRDAINTSVNAVLRASMAAKCTRRPTPNDRTSSPMWFIADHLPEDLMSVANGVQTKAHRAHDALTETERKLTPHEAGEDRLPAPIEVTVAKKAAPVTADNRADEMVFEEIATASVPVTVTELAQITGLRRWSVNESVSRLIRAGRIFSRIESDDEGVVRTGGSGKPRAKHPRLFWPSEPVPIRTTLPLGSVPLTSSQEWSDRLKQLREEDEKRILEYLVRPPNNSRTSGKIARAVGIEMERCRWLLDELVSRRSLRKATSGFYYLITDPVRTRTVAPKAPPPPPLRPAPLAPVTEAANAIEQLVSRLADERNAELQREADRLRAELTNVRNERNALQDTLNKIREQF